jgi:hypothetical protein
MVEARQRGSQLDFAHAEQIVGRPERGDGVSQRSIKLISQHRLEGRLEARSRVCYISSSPGEPLSMVSRIDYAKAVSS